MSGIAALFVLLTLAVAALLFFLLLRPGIAPARSLWGLSALLPLLVAVSASLGAQGQAIWTLRESALFPAEVDIVTDNRKYHARLNPEEAACLERGLRLHWQGRVETPQGFIPINARSKVIGTLPETRAVNALSIQGRLRCPTFKSAPAKES